MPDEVRITYGRVPAALMRQPDAIAANVQRAAVDAAVPYVERQLALNTPSGATGKARQSVTSRRGPDAGTARVGYSAPAGAYIGFVNDGTRPHWPPIDPLRLWAARVLGNPGLGFAVARTIAHRGLKARRFVERTATHAKPEARRLMRAAIDRELREIGR